MFNIRDSNVFFKIGEAIGNVAAKVTGTKEAILPSRREYGRFFNETYSRRLKEEAESLMLPGAGGIEFPEDEVIEAAFTVLEDREGS